MQRPNSVDYVAWARYNEWLSGARKVVFPATVKRRVPRQVVHGPTGNPRVIPASFMIPTMEVIIGIMKDLE